MNTVDWSIDRMQHTAEVPFNAALMPLGQLEWLDENRGFRYPILPNIPAITPFLTPLGSTERSESPPNGRPHRLSDLFRDNPSNEYSEEPRSYRDEPPELIPLLSDARTLLDSEDGSTQPNQMQIVVSDFDEEEAGTKPSSLSFSSRLFANPVAPTPTPTPTRPVRPTEHQIYRTKQTVVKPRQGGPFKIPSPTRKDDGKENGRISSWDGLNTFAYGLTEVPPRIFHNHHNSYPVVLNPSIGIHSYQRVPDNSTGIPDVDDLSEIASMTNNTNDSNERDNLDEVPIPEGDEIDDYSRKKKQNMKIVPNHMRGASDDSIPVILEPIMGDSKGISIRRHDSGKSGVSDQSNGQNIRPAYIHIQKPTPVSIVARAAAEVAHAKFTVARRNRGPNGRIQISRKNTMTKLFGDGEEVKQDEGVSAIKLLLNSEKDKTIGELKDKNAALEKDMKLLMESKAKSMEAMASQMEKMRKEIANLKKENSKLREMYQSREPMIDLEHSCPNCDAMKDSKFRLIEVMSDEMLRLREICLKLHSRVSLEDFDDDDELSPLLIPIVPPISVSRMDRLSLTHTTTPTPKSTTTYTAADPNAPRPSRTQDLIEHFPEINFSILQNESSNTSNQQPLLSTSPFPALSSPNSNVHQSPHTTDEFPTSAATAAYLAAADRDNPFLDNDDQPYENHFHDRPLRSIKEEDLLSHASSALNSLTAVRLKSELDARRQMHEDDVDEESDDGEDMLAPPTVALTPQSSGTPSLPGHHSRMTSVTPTGTTILRKGTKSNSFDFEED